MAVTVAAVMRQVRNYFEGEPLEGDFTITGNGLSPAPDASWVAIRGSKHHDGVYQLQGGVIQGADSATDETFSGLVYPLYPPADFLRLCEEIAAYDASNPVGALQSESFGAYSYTRVNGKGDWREAYSAYLAPYRRMFPGVL